MNAAGHQRTHRLSTRHIDRAESAKPSIKKRLNAAIGPAMRTTGIASMPRRGSRRVDRKVHTARVVDPRSEEGIASMLQCVRRPCDERDLLCLVPTCASRDRRRDAGVPVRCTGRGQGKGQRPALRANTSEAARDHGQGCEVGAARSRPGRSQGPDISGVGAPSRETAGAPIVSVIWSKDAA